MLFLVLLITCLAVAAIMWRFGFYMPPYSWETRWHWTDRAANAVWPLPPQHKR